MSITANHTIAVEGIARPTSTAPDCASCAGRSRCLVQDLTSAADRPDLACTPSLRTLHRGDVLVDQGDPFDGVYLIRAGAMKAYVSDSNGDYQVTGFLGAGDLVGLGAVEHDRHGCAVEALDTTSVCRLDFEELSALAAASGGGVRMLLRDLSAGFNQQQSMLMRLGQKTAEQKLAGFLVERIARLRRQGLRAECIELPMSRADIGSYLSLAVETVSRLLTRLQAAGIISVDRHLVKVLDEARLIQSSEEPSGSPPRSRLH